RADFNSGVAPALVAGGGPIVIAHQYSVRDTSATFFAPHFYWSIAQGRRVGEAAREARIAGNYSLPPASVDWGIPHVDAPEPNSRLCPERRLDTRAMPSPVVGASSRRSVEGHNVRIAVWDTHAQFPALRMILERMNQAQKFYGFEIVDLSLPIDAWHMHGKTR